MNKLTMFTEKLQPVYDRAMSSPTPKGLFLAIYDYIELFDKEEPYASIGQKIVASGNADQAPLNEYAKQAEAEIVSAYDKVVAYLEGKVTPPGIQFMLDRFRDLRSGAVQSTGKPLNNLHGSLTRAILYMKDNPSGVHLPFCRTLSSMDETDNRVENWIFSPAYDQWENENAYQERIKHTKIWYSWDCLVNFFRLFRDFEKEQDKALADQRWLEVWGIKSWYEELEKVMTSRTLQVDSRHFQPDDYKRHLQKVHSYACEQLATVEREKPAETVCTYLPDEGLLILKGKVVKLAKHKFRAKIVEALFEDDGSKNTIWSWDELYETIEGIAPEDDKPRKKIYDACKGLVEYVSVKTGISDFLIYDTQTVRLNPKYL